MLETSFCPRQPAAPGKGARPPFTTGLHRLGVELERFAIENRAAKMRQGYMDMAARAYLLRLKQPQWRVRLAQPTQEITAKRGLDAPQQRWEC
jgi:hypothetical protein